MLAGEEADQAFKARLRGLFLGSTPASAPLGSLAPREPVDQAAPPTVAANPMGALVGSPAGGESSGPLPPGPAPAEFGRLDALLAQALHSSQAAARPAFQASLRGRFLAPVAAVDGAVDERLDAGPVRAAGRLLKPRFARQVMGLAAALAAGLLLWVAWPRGADSGLGEPGRPAPRWKLVQVQGASYGGPAEPANLLSEADGEVQVGQDPLRLILGDAVRLFLSEGSLVDLKEPCWLHGNCLESSLALKANTEAVVLADASQHPVQVHIKTPQASVLLFGAEASIKPCGVGTCIVIQSGRALVEPRGGMPRELSAGDRLWVGSNGEIDFESGYVDALDDPAVQARMENLKRSRAEVAAGVF
jgi:hypothetical protein